MEVRGAMLHHKNIKKKKALTWHCAVPNKIHTYPIGNSKEGEGGGILEAKILEQAKYEAKVDFFGGGECKWGEYGYFLELHNLLHII